LKETRPLWPPQRGVGLQEPNLGKTNPRVTLFICLRFVFHPLSRTRFFITNANPACSCVYICKFQFRPIHPPSRRLSHTWYWKMPSFKIINPPPSSLSRMTQWHTRIPALWTWRSKQWRWWRPAAMLFTAHRLR
jgi:hypothetical protein